MKIISTALDVSGDGWFDLFIDDTDRNGVPDRIFIVKYGNDEEWGKVEELAALKCSRLRSKLHLPGFGNTL